MSTCPAECNNFLLFTTNSKLSVTHEKIKRVMNNMITIILNTSYRPPANQKTTAFVQAPVTKAY